MAARPSTEDNRFASVRDVLARWERHAKDVVILPGVSDVTDALDALVKEHTGRCQDRIEGAQHEATIALESLESLAGGREGGESWKSKLSETSARDDVLRDAQYYLLKPPGVEKTLLPHYDKLTTAWAAYEAVTDETGIALDTDMTNRKNMAFVAARATATEAFFIETLETKRGKGRKTALQARVRAMGQKQIPSSAIAPAIWQRVMEAVQEQ